MELVLVLSILVGIVAVCGEEAPITRVVKSDSDGPYTAGLEDTELVLAFVIFRHGDRTPDDEELAVFPDKKIPPDVYFPYGKKALTNKGKQRSFIVGKYLRKLYDGFLSKLYLPDQITTRTTYYARTQMTALAVLSGLFPPPLAQKWNPTLDWQPIPYNSVPFADDDLMYYYNCPRYIALRNQTYEDPEIKKWLEPYHELFHCISEHTGANITTPEDVFNLDNLFQTLHNVGVEPPKWAKDVMSKIKDITKIEYAVQYYTPELIKLASGVMMNFFLNETKNAIDNPQKPVEPELYLFSAHENNVAGLMAAARVFEPHQPNYSATFSLELRRNTMNNEYGITAKYAPDAGKPGKLLPINGCGGQSVCSYEQFVALMQDIVLTKEEFFTECEKPL